MKTRLPFAALLCLSLTMPGCAVVAVAGAAVGTAASVAGTVIGTTVKVAGKVVEKTVDVVVP